MTTDPVPSALKREAIETLAKHGKTFYWASFFLGKNRSALAALLYSCCRQLDDIADTCADNKLEARRVLSRIKTEILQTGADDMLPVSRAWRYLIQTHGVDPTAVTALIDGLVTDTDAVCFSRQCELDRYSYRVAGTVGIMMCPILGVRTGAAMPFAIDLGIAMQLTNICRDVLEDASLGRRYVPVDVPAAELLSATQQRQRKVAIAVAAQLERAEQFYDSALTGLVYLPRGSRIAIYLAAVIYRAIGRKLRARQYRWWHGRIMVSPLTKLLITMAAMPAVARLLLARSAGPDKKHNRALHEWLVGLPHVNS